MLPALPIALGMLALPLVYQGANLAYEYLTGALERKQRANKMLSDLTTSLLSGGSTIQPQAQTEWRGPLAQIGQASMQPFMMGLQAPAQGPGGWNSFGFGAQQPVLFPQRTPQPSFGQPLGFFGGQQLGLMGGGPQFAQQAFNRMLPLALYPPMFRQGPWS